MIHTPECLFLALQREPCPIVTKTKMVMLNLKHFSLGACVIILKAYVKGKGDMNMCVLLSVPEVKIALIM